MEELVHFTTEDMSDIRYELIFSPDGTSYAEIIDEPFGRAKSRSGYLEHGRLNRLAERILAAIGGLEIRIEPCSGVSETTMRVTDYRGQTKDIGYNEQAPNEELDTLRKELMEMCLEMTEGMEWESLYPLSTSGD